MKQLVLPLLLALVAAIVDAQFAADTQKALDRATWDINRMQIETRLRGEPDLARQRTIATELEQHITSGRQRGWQVPGAYVYGPSPYTTAEDRARWETEKAAIDARLQAETNAERRHIIQEELNRHKFWGQSKGWEGDFGANPFSTIDRVRWEMERLQIDARLRLELDFDRRQTILNEYNRHLLWGSQRGWYTSF